MLTSHFTFQDDKRNPVTFSPVVENYLGERDEAFLPDDPKNILLSKDLELVPWMVGLTTSEGAFFAPFFPELFQAGETKLLHQKV
jgi:hypothetical protein